MVPKPAERHYRGEAGQRYHQEKRGIPAPALSWVARLRVEKISPYVKDTDVVFEYGVGAGWNLAELRCGKKLGYDVADFLAPEVKALGIEFVAGAEAETVDVVVCHHTLEHVFNPPEVLAEIFKMLRSGGKLLLFVPYEKEGRYAHFNKEEPNHHLYSWNAQTLGNLVEECGFRVLEAGLGQFGYDRFAAAWAMKLKLGEAGFRGIRKAAHLLKPAREVRVITVKN